MFKNTQKNKNWLYHSPEFASLIFHIFRVLRSFQYLRTNYAEMYLEEKKAENPLLP